MDAQTITPTQRQRWIARTLNTIAAARGLHQQRDIARAIGWTESKLSRKLHQGSRFSLEDLDIIAAGLAVPTEDLLNGWGGRVPIPETAAKVLPFPRRLAGTDDDGDITCHDVAACHTTQAVAA